MSFKEKVQKAIIELGAEEKVSEIANKIRIKIEKGVMRDIADAQRRINKQKELEIKEFMANYEKAIESMIERKIREQKNK